MNVEEFFEILIKEMEHNEEIRRYHRFLKNPKYFDTRKSYFCQRLEYLTNQLNSRDIKIWDCGCGYATTGLFLAMNGYRVHGTTIGDHYFNGIQRRLEFWSKYGDSSLFTVSCESLFDAPQAPDSYDVIIIQDTLHHLEPLPRALAILNIALKPDGKLIILEANGKNPIHKLRLFLIRGNKRVIKVYDEYLKKNVLYGNENFRSLEEWKKEFIKQCLVIDSDVQYIKSLIPYLYDKQSAKEIVKIEQNIAQKSKFLREYFFFGMNFVARKSNLSKALMRNKHNKQESCLV